MNEPRSSLAATITGLLLVAFGVFAGLAARSEWIGAPSGRVLGLITAIVAALAAAVALITGPETASTPLLAIAVVLGIVTAVAVLVDRPQMTGAHR